MTRTILPDMLSLTGRFPHCRWAHWCGLAALSWSMALLSGASRAAVLDDYLALVTGSFDSSAQAARDQRYEEVVWHTTEIWRDRDAAGTTDVRWTYTENWFAGMDQPYRQRINRYLLAADGSILVDSYPVPDAQRYVGAWQDSSRFDQLASAQLGAAINCTARLARTGAHRFEGGTVGQTCHNDYQGASYLVSHSLTDQHGVQNWDRGFDENGEQVWGPVAGPYQFRRRQTAVCAAPVLMLVHGEIFDRQAFGAYIAALGESGLYPANQGYYRAISPATDVFEGDIPDGRGVVLARFPCLDAARRFWDSDEYQQIKALRMDAARFEVSVFRELPVPPYIDW